MDNNTTERMAQDMDDSAVAGEMSRRFSRGDFSFSVSDVAESTGVSAGRVCSSMERQPFRRMNTGIEFHGVMFFFNPAP